MNKIEEVNWAYIAGLIDGEGSIILYRHHQSKNGKLYTGISHRVCISNTNKEVLIWVNKLTGLGLLVNQPRRQQHYQDSYRLDISGKKQLLQFLPHVIPYMRIKQSAACEMLISCMTRQNYGDGSRGEK